MDCVPTRAAVLDYGVRWSIEPMFSDFKGRGFALEDSQLEHADRLERLILIMSLAMYWCVQIGQEDALNCSTPLEIKTRAQTDINHWSFKKLYRSLVSWFTRGLRFLKRYLTERPPSVGVLLGFEKLIGGKVGLTGIAFVLDVTEETVLAWLARASAKACEINDYLLRDLPVTRVQLDEMWSFIRSKHTQEPASHMDPCAATDGAQWIWLSYAPEYRLMLTAVVGPRTLETAKAVVKATASKVRGIPAYFSDGFTCYFAALIAVYHTITTFPRTGKRGRPKAPRIEPHPELVYGQLVKEKKDGRLVTLKHAHPLWRPTHGCAWPFGEHILD
jgi:hypothetical protein